MAKPSSWSLDDSGKILRYPHVSPNQDFTVKVSGELLAADGTRLGRDVEQRVHTGELDPAVGFASQGSVLPAKESRGLPVVSVNVDEIDVEFLRVDEGSLSQFFSEYQRGGRRGSWELERDYGDHVPLRSEEHTSELQSLMRISYAVFCLKKNTETHETKP